MLIKTDAKEGKSYILQLPKEETVLINEVLNISLQSIDESEFYSLIGFSKSTSKSFWMRFMKQKPSIHGELPNFSLSVDEIKIINNLLNFAVNGNPLLFFSQDKTEQIAKAKKILKYICLFLKEEKRIDMFGKNHRNEIRAKCEMLCKQKKVCFYVSEYKKTPNHLGLVIGVFEGEQVSVRTYPKIIEFKEFEEFIDFFDRYLICINNGLLGARKNHIELAEMIEISIDEGSGLMEFPKWIHLLFSFHHKGKIPGKIQVVNLESDITFESLEEFVKSMKNIFSKIKLMYT